MSASRGRRKARGEDMDKRELELLKARIVCAYMSTGNELDKARVDTVIAWNHVEAAQKEVLTAEKKLKQAMWDLCKALNKADMVEDSQESGVDV